MLHINTGVSGSGSRYYQPWQWHKALAQGSCPNCGVGVYKRMGEISCSFICIACYREYFWPVNWGQKVERIWFAQRDRVWILRWLRVEAFNHTAYQLDDCGRDNRTGRFTAFPKWRRFSHLSWERTLGILRDLDAWKWQSLPLEPATPATAPEARDA